MAPLNAYLILSALLFGLGVAGFAARRNLLMMLMSVELMLNAGNLALVACARRHAEAHGATGALMVIAVAAAEVAVGLALVVALFRLRRTVNADEVRQIRA